MFYATNTHSAYVQRLLSATEWSQTYHEPGITLLDVRMAIRVEELWEKYIEEGKAILPPPGTLDPGVQVMSVMGYGLTALGVKNPRLPREKSHPKSKKSLHLSRGQSHSKFEKTPHSSESRGQSRSKAEKSPRGGKGS